MSGKFHTLAVCSGAALLFGGIALQASTYATERFDLPFAFHVQKQAKVLPAGQYEVERNAGSPFAVLKNVKTGEQVQVLSSENMHENGKTKLVFSKENDGISLKNIL